MAKPISAQPGSLPSLLAGLKALAERSGALVADSYARAAGSFLERLERVEDLNAERRFQQRSGSRRASASKHRLPK